jgi:methylmalonyl-CoA mutase N-terminal domain/subunit
VLGGAQSLHTNSYDEALSLPSEEAALLALRTQQVLAHETGVADSVDPLGGSYMIERLTTDLESRAAAILGEIDAMGGVLAALEAGYFHHEIAAAAYAYQRAIESGEIEVVGVNRFARTQAESESKRESEPASAGRDNERAQRARLAAWRAGRDGARASASLEALAQAADDPRANLIPRMIDAVKAGTTLGEISGRLRARFGVYREKVSL